MKIIDFTIILFGLITYCSNLKAGYSLESSAYIRSIAFSKKLISNKNILHGSNPNQNTFQAECTNMIKAPPKITGKPAQTASPISNKNENVSEIDNNLQSTNYTPSQSNIHSNIKTGNFNIKDKIKQNRFTSDLSSPEQRNIHTNNTIILNKDEKNDIESKREKKDEFGKDAKSIGYPISGFPNIFPKGPPNKMEHGKFTAADGTTGNYFYMPYPNGYSLTFSKNTVGNSKKSLHRLESLIGTRSFFDNDFIVKKHIFYIILFYF